MERKELEEALYKDIKKTARCLTRVLHDADNGKTLSIADLYPELRSTLKNKAYTNWVSVASSEVYPPTIQLPFYDTVLFSVSPAKTSELFERTHGISVDEIIALAKDDKIIPVLSMPYTDYSDLRDDYLDPVLALDPPTTHRMKSFYTLIRAMSEDYVSESTTRRLNAPLKEWARRYDATAQRVDREPFDFCTLEEKELYKRGVSTSYANLCAYGYCDLAQQLIALMTTHAREAVLAFLLYEKFLVDIPLGALGGIPSANQADLDIFEEMTVKSGRTRYRGGNVEGIRKDVFPVDVAKQLIRIKSVYPGNLSYEEQLDLREDTAAMRKALFALNKEVVTRQEDKILERAAALREASQEAIKGSTLIQRKRKRGELIIFSSIQLALGGGIAAFQKDSALGGLFLAGLPGVLSTLLWKNLRELPVVERSIDYLAKLRQPSYVTAIYDLSKIPPRFDS